MENLLHTAVTLLITGYLSRLSLLIVDSFHLKQYEEGNMKLLKAITEPFTQYVIKVNVHSCLR